MLILTRKPGQSIMIGDTITVKIIENERGQIRIGIDAPKEIHILRSELVDRGRELKS